MKGTERGRKEMKCLTVIDQVPEKQVTQQRASEQKGSVLNIPDAKQRGEVTATRVLSTLYIKISCKENLAG